MDYFQQDDTIHAANKSMTTSSKVISTEKSPNAPVLLESLFFVTQFFNSGKTLRKNCVRVAENRIKKGEHRGNLRTFTIQEK